ncbi:3422_t:CDS:10 [Funneliformis caledonium]|uniref:3422_t:CDS:1 n=1 Tax=Funneliformis caledonium TaxID=1117310 RepID=A0A9N8W7C3_9GLOM|nr:3422_t:CDS:10 [Funneliformis caledonium]
MNIFTGDESGLNAAASPIVKTWGKIDRSKSIQLMHYTRDNKKLIVARKNGQISILDPNEDGKSCQEFSEPFVTGEQKTSARFVGLFANNSTLVTCTDQGMVQYRSILEDKSSTIETTLTLVPDLCRLRVHPKEHHIFACGGKERELSVWDVNAYKEGNCLMKSQKKKESKPGLVWMSKNVSHDFLDLRVPVWITDLQFLSEQETTKLVVGTKYNQIRIYDTKAKRRPVSDFNIGHNPVVSLIVGRNSNEIIFTDTVCNVCSMDVRTGKILGQLKGFSGSVTNLAVATESSLLVSVAMDRFLRIHEIGASRELVKKIYLKQRLTSVVVDESEDGILGYSKKEAEKDDSEEEKFWEGIEEVKPKKRKTKH